MSDPTESPPAAPKRRPRRIFGIGAILLGVPTLLWIGAGFFVARSLRYPDFLRRGGQDAFGQHVPQFKRGSITDIGAALGVEPERLDCGVVEEDGIAHHQVSVVGWYFPGKRREVVVIIPPAGAPETAMIPYVKFLLGAGYTVVASYSANDPKYGINWGMLKRKFALATARTLMDDGFTKIAALGISEGAAGAIMAQAEQPVFTAIVADSSYANLERLFMRSPSMSAAESGVPQHGDVGSAVLVRPQARPDLAGDGRGQPWILRAADNSESRRPGDADGRRPGDPRRGRLQRADVDGAVRGSRRRAVRGSCRIRRARDQIS